MINTYMRENLDTIYCPSSSFCLEKTCWSNIRSIFVLFRCKPQYLYDTSYLDVRIRFQSFVVRDLLLHLSHTNQSDWPIFLLDSLENQHHLHCIPEYLFFFSLEPNEFYFQNHPEHQLPQFDLIFNWKRIFSCSGKYFFLFPFLQLNRYKFYGIFNVL